MHTAVEQYEHHKVLWKYIELIKVSSPKPAPPKQRPAGHIRPAKVFFAGRVVIYQK
jgi:hypothetical protein